MSSSNNSESDVEPRREHRMAKKSTAAPKYATRNRNTAKISPSDRFMENFNPETSIREKRKLSRKINPPSSVKRPPGALYDEYGVHIATLSDLCDCLDEMCMGCWYPCMKCGSQKCGLDCRVHRKYMPEQIEYHGYDIVIKNPVLKY